MNVLKSKKFFLAILFIFTVSLYADGYDLLGKWNVYSFSKR
ncbi:MAG: hypothetical protein PF693_03065 [Spirochaetia bacterium]|nr:hypothetical protein [Spirochaetia bacterium]